MNVKKKKQGGEEGRRDGGTVEEGAEPPRSEGTVKQRGLSQTHHSGGGVSDSQTIQSGGPFSTSDWDVEVQNDWIR